MLIKVMLIKKSAFQIPLTWCLFNFEVLRCFNRVSAYFKVTRVTDMKFHNFAIISS